MYVGWERCTIPSAQIYHWLLRDKTYSRYLSFSAASRMLRTLRIIKIEPIKPVEWSLCFVSVYHTLWSKCAYQVNRRTYTHCVCECTELLRWWRTYRQCPDTEVLTEHMMAPQCIQNAQTSSNLCSVHHTWVWRGLYSTFWRILALHWKQLIFQF